MRFVQIVEDMLLAADHCLLISLALFTQFPIRTFDWLRLFTAQ